MTATHPAISVVIPAHNEAGSIEPRWAAIVDTLEQAGIDYEVLVVDDASTDARPRSCVVGRPRTHAFDTTSPTIRAASATRCGPGSTSSRATPSRS